MLVQCEVVRRVCSVERFTAYHRRSYICKAGLGDVLIGAAAVISDCECSARALVKRFDNPIGFARILAK